MGRQRRRGSSRSSSSPTDGMSSGSEDHVGSLGNAERASAIRGPDAGLITNAEKSLGGSFSDVSVTSTGLAESKDAAAIAHGRKVDVNPAVVGNDGGVPDQVMAHELIHMRHQQQESSGSAADMEEEAHEGIDSVLSGAVFSVAGGTGGYAQQPFSLTEWWNSVSGGSSDPNELSGGQAVRQGQSTSRTDFEDSRQTTPQTYYGTGDQVRDADGLDSDGNLASYETNTSGGRLDRMSETLTPGGYSVDFSDTSYETYGDGTLASTTESNTAGVSWADGTVSDGSSYGMTEQRVDRDATATAVATAMNDRATGMDVRVTELGGQLTTIDGALAESTSSQSRRRDAVYQQLVANNGGEPVSSEDEQAALATDEDYQRLRTAEAQLRRQRADLEGEKSLLEADRDALRTMAGQVNADNAEQMAASTGVAVEPVMTTTSITESQNTVRDLDILAGNYSTTDTNTSSFTDGDYSETDTNSSQSQWSINGGISNSRSETSTNSVVVDENNRVSNSTTSGNTGGIAVLGDGEYGLTAGRNASENQTTVLDGERNSTTTERSGSVTVTNQGVRGQGNASATHEGDNVLLGARTSADGRFTVNVVQKSSDPPKYEMVVTISVGGSASLSANRASPGEGQDPHQVTGGVGGNVGGSAQMVYRHEMNRDEATRYVAELANYEAGSTTNGSMPEFGMLDRFAVLGDQAGDGEMLSVVDGAFARDISPGDSYELTLTGTAGVNGNLGASQSGSGGLGVTAGGGMDWQRTRKVRVGAIQDATRGRLTTLTVEFASQDGWNANAGMTYAYGAAGAGGSHTEQDTSGSSSTFRLDPNMDDYDQVYDRIVRVESREALAALADDPSIAAHRHGYTETLGDTSTDGVNMSVGPLAVNLSGSDSYSESVTNEGGNLSGTFTGDETLGGNIEVGGVRLHEDSQNTSGTAAVDSDGNMSVNLTQTDTSNSVLNLGADGGQADSRSLVERMLGQSPEQTLEREIRTTLTSMWGFTLDEAAVNTVVGRASNESMWGDCAEFQSVDNYGSWMSLRGRLRSPRPDAEWVEVNADRARKLDQCRAIARFMQSAGSSGLAMMRNCMRYWGETMNDYGSRAADAGMMFEWPAGLLSIKPKYDTCESEHATLDSRVSAWQSGGAEQVNSGWEKVRETLTKVDECRNTIRAFEGFNYPRAKMEMMEHLDEMRTDFYSALGQLTYGEANGMAMENADVMQLENEQNRDRLERRMRQFKNEERSLLSTASEASFDDQDGFFDTAGFMLGVGTPDEESHTYLSRVNDLQEYWITQILELRGLYQQLDVPQSEWIVSTGPGAERNHRHEPEYGELNRLWQQETWDQWAARRDNNRRIDRFNNY